MRLSEIRCLVWRGGSAGGEKDWIEKGTDTKGGRWVVITSINYPTPSVKRLSQLPGWQVATHLAAMTEIVVTR